MLRKGKERALHERELYRRSGARYPGLFVVVEMHERVGQMGGGIRVVGHTIWVVSHHGGHDGRRWRGDEGRWREMERGRREKEGRGGGEEEGKECGVEETTGVQVKK